MFSKALSTLSQKTAAVAENGRRFRRQSPFVAEIGGDYIRQCGQAIRIVLCRKR